MLESMTDAHKKELSKLIAIGIFTANIAVKIPIAISLLSSFL